MGYLVTVESIYLISKIDVFISQKHPNTGGRTIWMSRLSVGAYPLPPQSSPPVAAVQRSYKAFQPQPSLGVNIGVHLLLHLSHLNHGRQGEVHIKDRCFHVGLLTPITACCLTGCHVNVGGCWHLLLHLMHPNQWRQYKVHIKDGCFHWVLLAIKY